MNDYLSNASCKPKTDGLLADLHVSCIVKPKAIAQTGCSKSPDSALNIMTSVCSLLLLPLSGSLLLQQPRIPGQSRG